ncbi:heavy-metal-associated domain-containing protein [Gracilimonas mengyeensis]|uniref:Copper chaperone CopZ n=1 Tax=Gracilimonas mengyeensis TaxID=1302730 RepID=A0A521D385_9BACT|nr:heavy metal-associated domain-containing protein [Gracilimonas mengyeensis]SMO66112.1 Copper chaperone CopZ [Gracilimonas mengyeensis]
MKTLTKTILRSDELNCPSCVNNIESNLNSMEGIEKATVKFNSGKIEVDHNPELVTEDDLLAAVQQSGYSATVSPF